MSGFRKDKFVRTVDIPVSFKQVQAEEQGISEEAVFTVSIKQHKEVEAVNEWYFNLKQEEREDLPTVLDFVLKTVCAALVKEPTGFDDFPADDRPLYDRALEYFTGNEQDIQDDFNDMLAYVFNQRDAKLAKDTFPSLPDDREGDSGIQPENPEGRSL